MKNKKKSRGNKFRFSYSNHQSSNYQGTTAFNVSEDLEELAKVFWKQAKIARSVHIHYKNSDENFVSRKQWDMVKRMREDMNAHWNIINRSIAKNKEK